MDENQKVRNWARLLISKDNRNLLQQTNGADSLNCFCSVAYITGIACYDENVGRATYAHRMNRLVTKLSMDSIDDAEW